MLFVLPFVKRKKERNWPRGLTQRPGAERERDVMCFAFKNYYWIFLL